MGFNGRRLTLDRLAAILVLTMCAACDGRGGFGSPPYLNPRLSVEERVDDLVGRMTLEEKVSQMLYNAPAIDRLRIPAYNWWNEALHGVARAGRATVFPQAIGLAASWDTDMMHRVATAISDEARAKHHEFVRRGKRGIYQGLTFWSPNINIFRDPRWGRGMETYGEDPYLTGQLAVEFVRGMQGENPNYLKTVATSKHYAVHSGPEPDRHTFDARTDARDLLETYLPAFEMTVREARVASVMCAYNRYQGDACCGSSFLLSDILRNRWGFDGYVVSDCWAINDIWRGHKIVETSAEAAALAVKSGCDLNCGDEFPSLVEAVEKGLLAEDEIDTAVKRLFTARFRLGMFDPPEMVPYAGIGYEAVDSDEHRDLALEAARKSIVLLKNDRNTLPLNKNIGAIAVIGPNADNEAVLLGNYNGFPSEAITPLEGIERAASVNTEVLYARGCDHAANLPTLEVVPASVLFTPNGTPGLVGEYFANSDLAGEPGFSRIDKEIDFDWGDGAPSADLDDDNFSIRWTGFLVPQITGRYALGGNGFYSFRISLDDNPIAEHKSIHHPDDRYRFIDLEAGRRYNLKIEYAEVHGDARMALLWAVPDQNLQREAMQTARKADAVILVMGLSPRLEGEEMMVEVEGFAGGDRLTLDLPRVQRDLIQAIVRLAKPTVLVLLNGSALSVTGVERNVRAIVEAWYPGQAAGDAIADAIFGDYNPGGRLPVTFYRSTDQLPPFEDYSMAGRTYRYFRDTPLYPFGHGLSYTTFGYSNLRVPPQNRVSEPVTVAVDVQNTGRREGDEVVQLYLRDVEASVPVPVRSLVGFRRIGLKAGQKRTVEFEIPPRHFSLIDDQGRRVIEPGTFEVAAGGKQPGFTGGADAASTGVLTARFNLVGRITPVGD